MKIQHNEIITISVDEYLNHELVEKIALMHWNNNEIKFTNQIRRFIYEKKYFSDCFNVIAINASNDVVGRLFCIQNQENPKRWYHGDLMVKSEYRRMKIASNMIRTAIQKISDMGGEILNGYTANTNTASINLHKSLGFVEKPCVQFDDLIFGDEQIMLELKIENKYNVMLATVEDAGFIYEFYQQNRAVLHGNHISFNEWKEASFWNDTDEQNFLICKGAIPFAWLRINGLDNPDSKEKAWISMLIVSDKSQRQGIGTFAIKFAEDYVKSKGFTKMGIHTSGDNIAAKNLYENCGYIITAHKDGNNPDGTISKNYTFEKVIST